jgi:ribose 5-phosphate isomerase B
VKIALASDHRGFAAKERIVALLKNNDHEIHDFGCKGADSCDYPDFALPAAQAVADGACECAVLICGTGLGMSIAANKVAGVRAALCHDEMTAAYSRKHNDANVLCLPADLIGEQMIRIILETWLSTKFEGGRHARRIEKIARIECSEPSE